MLHQVLIVGGGSIGERHLRCFQRTGRANVLLCEPQEELRTRLQQQYSLSQTFASLDEAFTVSCDIAVVCAPAHLHVPLTERLLIAGICTLIEKPLSTGIQGCEALIRLAEEKDVVAGVAYVYRHHPALAAMRTAIQSGRFGRPVQVVSVSGQHFPFYRPAYREIYYNNHATGGGAIQDALTHQVNAVEWLVGPVVRLVSDARHSVLPGVDVEDTVHLLTRHAGTVVTGHETIRTVMGSFALNQHQSVNESSITVVCEHGLARFEVHQKRWLSGTAVDGPWNVEETFDLQRDDLFAAQAAAFVTAVETGAVPACSLREALQTLNVNLAALDSAETGRWIDLSANDWKNA